MKHFNSIKSLTTKVVNSNRLLILCLSLAVFGVDSAWGNRYYAKGVADLNSNSPSGAAKVYSVTPNDAQETGTSGGDVEVTFKAEANAGYSFKGWTDTKNGTSIISGSNQTSWKTNIKAETNKDKTKTTTYYAYFTANTYKVVFNKNNEQASGSMEEQSFTYGTAQNLTAIAFSQTYTVSFDVNGGTPDPEQKSSSRPFNGWATSADGAVLYTNQQNINNLTTTDNGTVTLYAKWGDQPAIKLPSASKTGSVLEGWFDGDAKVGEAGQDYTPTKTVSLQAHWVNQYDFDMSCAIDNELKVGDIKSDAFNFTHADNPNFTIEDPAIISYNAATNTVTALQAGTTTITFNQSATTTIKSGSKQFSFTVSKIANTLAADATHSMKVDETWSPVISGKNSDATVTTTSSDETVAYYDVANDKIVAQNTSNQSFNSKEVTITISQAATYKYTAVEKTITVTVNKWDNNISINGSKDSYATSIYMDAQQSISLTATNTDYSSSPITATQTSGNTIATLNAAQTQVTSNHNLGDATWTVSQPENYKYKAANASFTIHVVKEAEATDCYVKNLGSQTLEQKLGKETDKFTWTDKNAAGTLSYQVVGQRVLGVGSVGNSVQAYQLVNGAWIKAGKSYDDYSNDNYSSNEVTLDSAATGFYFTVSGSYASTLKDVHVTRKTYLNASDFTITETSSHNPVHPNEVGVGTLTINHSLANGGNLKVKWDNDKFTIDGKTATQGIDLGDLGCSTGVSNLPISYTSAEAGTHTANVVIYNNVYRATATITGTTIKRDQDIQWNTEIMIIGQVETKAAQTNSIIDHIVTYTSDNIEVIRVKEDANGQLTILEALQPGTAKITAFSAGNGEYNDASVTKEITVTDKNVQFIVWDQSLMGLRLNDGNVTLTASASQPDSLSCQTGGQRPITYQSANESIVKVINNNQLKIIGAGVTTIIATQAGGKDSDGHDFIAVTAEKKVVVRDPNAPCETYIYEQTSEVEFDLGWNEANKQTKTKEIDFGGQEPRYVNFDYKGKSHNVIFEYYDGSLCIDQYVNGAWQEVKNLGQPTKNGNYANTGDISLNRAATMMRVRVEKGLGYMYFKDCQITLARYLEGSTLNKFETKVGSPVQQSLTVNYSNISGPLTFSVSDNKFTIDKTSLEGVCGDKGYTTITITYNPTVASVNDEATLTLADGERKTYITLKGTATVTPLHIDWNLQENISCYTIDQFTLSAKALTDLNEEITNFVWFGLAQNSTTGSLTSGNILTFDKAGTAIVTANTNTGDSRFSPAPTVTKTWTVNLTPTEITTEPQIDGDIVYGAKLSDLKLKEGVGAARNTVNQQAVEGTFAITSGDISSAGQHTVTVTFTPANTDMYAPCTKDIPVTVLKADPSATAHAGEIIYGAKVESSELTNTGETQGTWSWTDEKKGQELAVGTHEGLKVHFTPSDAANYNEIDGVVSLTVIAATPVLTWTAEHATANTVDALTFAASSTNTDIDAEIIYSIIAGDDCATINASTGVLTITKAGTITVQASQVATINFNAPTSITTTCAISLTPTEIVTAPEIDGDIVYGTQLKDLKLKANTGAAQNTVNQQAVEGTFAITSGDLSSAGEHTVTVTFTPANTDMYDSCTKDISVTVQKATPDATASAGDIVYGAKVESSVLTNTGATQGTWSWTDEKKGQELAVGTHEGLKVHFTPSDAANYNEIDGTVSLTVNKAAATLSWTSAPTEADVKEQLTYMATSNHSESAITYSITAGSDCATIDASTGELTITKAGTITVQASQEASTHYEAATAITVTTTLTGEFESVFNGNGDWNNPNNWTHGVPEGENPNVVISGSLTINGPISVGGLTIEQNGKVNIVDNGDLTVNGTSDNRETYGNLFVRNGGNITINESAEVNVYDFVVESSIGTTGTSISGQVTNGDKVICTNGAYIDINMDPDGIMDDTQWYGFTVPFPVDVQNGVYRKEGDTFRKCTYGVDYMINEYDATQRYTTGNGWKYIKTGQLQPGHFYYFTVNGNYNTYRFKAAENTLTPNNSMSIAINGDGPNANWNAVGNSTLTYVNVTGDGLPSYVQTYVNGESRYQVVNTSDAQFVVGCPFFIQASQSTTMVLQQANQTIDIHYAPREETTQPMCVRIAAEGQRFSDQMYLTASEEALDEYELGLDLVKVGVGTQSAQLWVNAYGQQLCVNNAVLRSNQAYYAMSIYAPQAGNYELSLPNIPTNGILYLLQDGYPIWNLNESPYTLECTKGTTNEYGLLFVEQEPQAPTGSQTISGNQSAQKILKDQQIYIQKNGTIFTISGQKVK